MQLNKWVQRLIVRCGNGAACCHTPSLRIMLSPNHLEIDVFCSYRNPKAMIAFFQIWTPADLGLERNAAEVVARQGVLIQFPCQKVTVKLVEEYIKPEEMVILCVIPAMSDFGNAEVGHSFADMAMGLKMPRPKMNRLISLGNVCSLHKNQKKCGYLGNNHSLEAGLGAAMLLAIRW